MNKTPTPQEWMQEFAEFNSAESVAPPRQLSESIQTRVKTDLHPSPWLVFAKLSGIHAVVGFVTLLFCPQFGFGLTEGMGLMALFAKFGEQACMAGCGAFFMGGSALTASLALRREEVRVIRSLELLQMSMLAMLSMGVFVCLGYGMAAGLAAFWILGSILGALGTFEAGVRLRHWVGARA